MNFKLRVQLTKDFEFTYVDDDLFVYAMRTCTHIASYLLVWSLIMYIRNLSKVMRWRLEITYIFHLVQVWWIFAKFPVKSAVYTAQWDRLPSFHAVYMLFHWQQTEMIASWHEMHVCCSTLVNLDHCTDLMSFIKLYTETTLQIMSENPCNLWW